VNDTPQLDGGGKTAAKSTFKFQSLNDSLDKLKSEFFQGYNAAMQDSEQ
jgi:hypothetical protein